MQQLHLLKLLFPLFSCLPCNVQALDLVEMLKKEEEMLSAVKDRQSKVVNAWCVIPHEALFYIDISTLEVFMECC